jgi:soluble lytic murein transglycosylase-like protein
MEQNRINRRDFLRMGLAGIATAVLPYDVFALPRKEPLKREDYLNAGFPTLEDPDLQEYVSRRIDYIKNNEGKLNETNQIFSRASQFEDYIKKHSLKIDSTVSTSLLGKESSGNPDVPPSKKKAKGISQMLSETAREMGLIVNEGIDQRLDPEYSIKGGLGYLQMQFERVGSNLIYALAAYNWGPNGIDGKHRELVKARDFSWEKFSSRRARFPLPTETRKYIRDILAYSEMLRNSETHGLSVTKMPLYSKKIYNKTRIKYKLQGESLEELSQKFDVDEEDISKLNPAILKYPIAHGWETRITHT